jgi:ornithine cyclodeaminase
MFTLLTDDDVRDAMTAVEAVALMRSALVEHHRADLLAPARLHAELGGGGLTFTAGRQVERVYGFRVYGTFEHVTEQVTVVFDEAGLVSAIITGAELGDRRTGALGGVAIDLLALPQASVLGVVGAGRQAWTQVWAAAAVRNLTHIRVFSRDPARRADFAARCERELGVAATSAEHAADAVDGADVIVLGTTSLTPVIVEDWVKPGAHVTTVGPKTIAGHECPCELATRADPVVTDSLAQLVAYGAPPIVDAQRVVSLGAILAGAHPGRISPTATTLYISTGLAGTEIVFASQVLDRIVR